MLAQHAGILVGAGRWTEAVPVADEALSIVEGADALWLPFALAVRGEAEVHLGRTGATWLERALAAAGDEPTLRADVASLEAAQAAYERSRPR